MQLRQVQEILDRGGMIHVSGPAGSGKTLLASFIASLVSKNGHVDWICADGKTTFITHLKKNIGAVSGSESNLTLTIVHGHERVKETILATVDRLKGNTKLVVVDPITRVLDMGRDNEVMWGRNLFEDILPTLAGLMITHELAIVLVSEVRSGESGDIAVHHGTLRKWVDIDLSLIRGAGSSLTNIYQLIEDEAPVLIGKMRLTNTGEVILDPVEENGTEVKGCLGSQSSSWSSTG